jgi:thymidylate synthase (FAD)
MAKRMLSAARRRAPLLFETAGPGCVRGGCPEGKMSCGEPAEVRREIAVLGKEVDA